MNAKSVKRLWRVLARGTAAEVLIYEKNRSAFILCVVKRMRLLFALGIEPFVEKRIFAHARKRRLFKIPGGDNSIGIDIIASDRHCRSANLSHSNNVGHNCSVTRIPARRQPCRSALLQQP